MSRQGHRAAIDREFRWRRRAAVLALAFPFLLIAGILGTMWLFGRSGPSGQSLATKCRRGDNWACGEAFRKLAKSSTSRDEAWTLGTELCQRGDWTFCYELTRLRGQYQDLAPATSLAVTLERACKAGYPQICGLRGSISVQGIEVEQNFEEARRWITMACEKGSAGDCYNSGVWMIEGKYGFADRTTGMKHLEIACIHARGQNPSATHHNACERLATEKINELPINSDRPPVDQEPSDHSRKEQ